MENAHSLWQRKLLAEETNMEKQRLLVFMIDALCDTDVEYMRTLKHFGWIL